MGQKAKTAPKSKEIKTEAAIVTAALGVEAVLKQITGKPTHDQVAALQAALNAEGVTRKDGKQLSVDKDFGKNTAYALKSYLAEHSGIELSPWMKARMEALGQPVGVHLNDAEKLVISDFLHLGKPTKEQTKDMQALLKRNGLYDMTVDGVIGKGTMTGLINAIAEDSSLLKGASPYMLAMLQKTVKDDAVLKATLIAETKGLTDAKKSREDVYHLQANLTLLGYNTRGVDGLRGGGTDAAVKAFEKDTADVEAVVATANAATAPAAPVAKVPVAEKKDADAAKPAEKPQATSIFTPSITSTLGLGGLGPLFSENAGALNFLTLSNSKPQDFQHPIQNMFKELGVADPKRIASFAELSAADSILDFIGDVEGGGDPNTIFGNRKFESLKGKKRLAKFIGEDVNQITDMSLGEFLSLQKALPPNKRAAGKLQFMPGTIEAYVGYMGNVAVDAGSTLSKKEIEAKIWKMPFDEDMQHFLGYAMLHDKGFKKLLEKGTKYVNSFGHKLAEGWAALVSPILGHGVYDGIAGNRAYVSWKKTKGAILGALKDFDFMSEADAGHVLHGKSAKPSPVKLSGVILDNTNIASLSPSLYGEGSVTASHSAGFMKASMPKTGLMTENITDILTVPLYKDTATKSKPDAGIFVKDTEQPKKIMSQAYNPALTLA
ncbi:MAG TPA: peptidoglycan-binding domain-containing protein [Alphaproteobacteria bacterium]|nr:peptidoglycan-binding domain-containing protein [Alphaproteobacteria bacterium]HNS44224.1 peptidoglycan-binding domain-containing protein [Alphaproteobacteria bacterium]